MKSPTGLDPEKNSLGNLTFVMGLGSQIFTRFGSATSGFEKFPTKNPKCLFFSLQIKKISLGQVKNNQG